MSLTIVIASLLIFLTLCCRTGNNSYDLNSQLVSYNKLLYSTCTCTLFSHSLIPGSLLTVRPATQSEFAPTSVSINCYFDDTCSNPSWDGPVLDESSRYRVTTGNEMSTLTIDPLREEDEGEYYCICDDNRRTGASNLVVQRKFYGMKNATTSYDLWLSSNRFTIFCKCGSKPDFP